MRQGTLRCTALLALTRPEQREAKLVTRAAALAAKQRKEVKQTMSQQSTEQQRLPTPQEVAELRTVFELEQLSDGYISEKIGTLIRSLRLEHAQIKIIENHLWEQTGRRVDTALVVWHEPRWCMVFARRTDPDLPNIRWLCVFNCEPEELLNCAAF